MNSNRVAKFIRIITAPPFMVAYLLMVLSSLTNFFEKKMDILISWIGLVIFPLFAYLVHRFIPAFYSKGREYQRKIAFIFSLIGYLICFVYGIIRKKSKAQMFFFVYFFTALLLTITNKLIHVRASGHTASAISPVVFSFIYVNPVYGIVFLTLFFISIWASLYIKRHKLKDIIAGLLCFVASLAISFFV